MPVTRRQAAAHAKSPHNAADDPSQVRPKRCQVLAKEAIPVEDTQGPGIQDDAVVLERVIVGVLLFTPLLLLLPTTLVYYLFGTLLYLAVATACTACGIAAELLHCNPLSTIVWRLARPHAFPGGSKAAVLSHHCTTGLLAEAQ